MSTLDSRVHGTKSSLVVPPPPPLQVDCYDARRNRIYFQTTSYDSDDDLGTTSIAYIDLSSRERLPSIAVSPSNFGFMGFHYVNVL